MLSGDNELLHQSSAILYASSYTSLVKIIKWLSGFFLRARLILSRKVWFLSATESYFHISGNTLCGCFVTQPSVVRDVIVFLKYRVTGNFSSKVLQIICLGSFCSVFILLIQLLSIGFKELESIFSAMFIYVSRSFSFDLIGCSG